MAVNVAVVLDGSPAQLVATPGTSLLRALRDAGHVATPGACEQGECGSCSVRLDGQLVCSCLVPAATCGGRSIDTVASGVAPELAAALARHGTVQCGFCTPGVVLAAEAVMTRAGDRPLQRGEVVEAMAGNLCRCTGYQGIVEAVLDVARIRRAGR